MSNLNKCMLLTALFLLAALVFPEASIVVTCTLTFVWGFLIAFVLMALVICYLFFSSYMPSMRVYYYKEGYKNGYEDKQKDNKFDDMKFFNIDEKLK